MSHTIPAGVNSKQSSFTVKGEKVDYVSYNGSTEPDGNFGNVGDVFHISTEHIYYREEGGWLEGTDSVTQHPVHGKMAFLSFTRGKGCWVLSGTLRSRKAKEGGSAKSEPSRSGRASSKASDEGSAVGNGEYCA